MAVRRRVVLVPLAFAAVACATANLDEEEGDPTRPAPRLDGGPGGDDAGAGRDTGGPGPGDDSGSVFFEGGTPIDASDGGGKACAVRDGLEVYCLARGQKFGTTGTLTYGTGFPAKLPAMGLGKPALGYLPADYPMTCIATPGTRGLSPPDNSAMGKICEVSFDNTNTTTVTGTASYVVTIANDAAFGDYVFGLTANAGTTIKEPSFWIRVTP